MKIFKILLLLILSTSIFASQLHVRLNDPIYPFLERMAVQGYLPYYLNATLPLTRDDVVESISKLNDIKSELSLVDQRILAEFMADYRYELSENKHFSIPEQQNTYMPFSSIKSVVAGIKNVFTYSVNREADHLVAYEKDDEMIWLDWDEMLRFETKNDLSRYLKQDAFRLSLVIGDHLSAYGDAYIYDMRMERGFTEPAREYKGGLLTVVQKGDKNDLAHGFDYSYGYVRYSSYLGTFSMGLEPRIWGNSRRSLILSNEVDPYASISWQRDFGRTRLSWFQGFINPPEETLIDTTLQKTGYIDKYVVGHRWEIPVSKRIQLAFTEMLIYGHRDPELAYYIPFVFYWPVQHSLTQANEDNIMWFAEGQIFPVDGIKIYGTLAIDEIHASDVFKNSAANRWGVQGGLLFSPKRMPLIPYSTDLLIEFTATRPWLYTHRVPLSGTYTHNSRSLGFPYGPNSQLVFIENRWWISPRSMINFRYQQLKHGENGLQPGDDGYYPIGNDPNENYSQSNPATRYSTYWLMGNIVTTRDFTIELAYQLTNILHIQLAYSHRWEAAENNFLSFQIRFDY